MLKVGLTGGIGSGKSTASKVLASLGSYIFDADSEAKTILANNQDVQNDIIKEFGSDVVDPKGNIVNKKLAKVAFQDEDHQIILNSIIHPYIFEEVDNRFKQISIDNKHSSFIVDGALLFESGLNQHMDTVVLIASLLKYRIERAILRGNITREDILNRINLQWTDEQKTEMADHIIHNNGTIQELEKKIERLHRDHL